MGGAQLILAPVLLAVPCPQQYLTWVTGSSYGGYSHETTARSVRAVECCDEMRCMSRCR